jgi:transposase
MPKIQVSPFYRFCRVKVMKQQVDTAQKEVHLEAQPDERYIPVCSRCHAQVKQIHSYHRRTVRDLNLFAARCFVTLRYRKLRCPRCGIVVEALPLIDPYRRVSKRLATYVLELCRYMSIKEIAEHLGLDWKTVKDIHKRSLQQKYSHEERGSPRILIVDEISIRKRHRYLTIIADWESGRVLGTGEGRNAGSLTRFFSSLSEEQRSHIEAVAMDMWDPYIKAVSQSCPQAKIVFDQFHVVAAYGRVIDKVRNLEYRNATDAGKAVMKGSKYLLLKNRENLADEEKPQLKALLELNEALSTTYILKDYLKRLWQYKYPRWAHKALVRWCMIAFESGIEPLIGFARTLIRYAYGIINHCSYPIHTGRLEGINNKIKVIKRRAYGFHDMEYFALVIKDAFARCNFYEKIMQPLFNRSSFYPWQLLTQHTSYYSRRSPLT